MMKKMLLKNVMLLSITFFVNRGFAQEASVTSGTQMPLANSYNQYFEAALHRLDEPFFTSIKPYNPRDAQSMIDSSQTAQILMAHPDKIGRGGSFMEKWLGRKLFNEDLIAVKGNSFAFFINPAVDFTLGKDANWGNKTPYFNTRGFRLVGNITNKFHYETEFYENQTLFPKYIHSFIQVKKVVPGAGGTKTFTSEETEDFAYARGSIAYQPNKFFNFRLGHGKHFFGDGYRSLLLSDNAAAYPYFEIMTTFWKIRYVNLWSQMLDNTRLGADSTYARKYVSTHYLSYNISKRLNISFFESVIYGDSTRTRGLDVNYLNPIIFFRPIEYSLNSNAGNVILGLNLKFKVTDQQFLYGQFLLDEFSFQELKKKQGFWGNKFGYQLGIKSFHTFIPNLTVQSEFNWIRPYTYSHYEGLQNYGNYHQPLAHPLGANFKESVTTLRYFYKRLFVEGRIIVATQGRDSLTRQYGTDIYQRSDTRPSDFGVYMLQGIRTKLLFGDFKTGFLVNPRSNLRLELGISLHQVRPAKELGALKNETTKFYSIGLKTDLNNFYYDF